MTVILLQFDIVWETSQRILNCRTFAQGGRPEKDSLVALPEMFATGFSMNSAVTAEAYESETEQFLSRMAKQFQTYLVAGAAMRGRDGRARNKALIFSPAGELIAFYAKMRPFTPGGEAQHYAAGQHPIYFRCADCTVSPFICYDLRFPELFRDAVAEHRPELLSSSPTFRRNGFIIGCGSCKRGPLRIKLTWPG